MKISPITIQDANRCKKEDQSNLVCKYANETITCNIL